MVKNVRKNAFQGHFYMKVHRILSNFKVLPRNHSSNDLIFNAVLKKSKHLKKFKNYEKMLKFGREWKNGFQQHFSIKVRRIRLDIHQKR